MLEEQLGIVAAIGIVRRHRHPFFQPLPLRDSRRVGGAADRVVNALAGEAERVGAANRRVGAERRGLGQIVHAQRARFAHHFLHREGRAGGLAVEYNVHILAVDEVAGDARRLVGLGPAVANQKLDQTAVEAALGIERLDPHLDRVGG